MVELDQVVQWHSLCSSKSREPVGFLIRSSLFGVRKCNTLVVHKPFRFIYFCQQLMGSWSCGGFRSEEGPLGHAHCAAVTTTSGGASAKASSAWNMPGREVEVNDLSARRRYAALVQMQCIGGKKLVKISR
jgi:hypothetical protein